MTQRIQSYRKLHDDALLEIEERKRISEELQLTQFCVDKASIGIFRISEEGEIRFANDLACRSLGYTTEELYSMTIFEIDPTFSRERFHEHRRTLRSDGFRTFETIHRRKDGSTFPVEITVNYLEYLDKCFTVSFAKDISERKRIEDELRLTQHCVDKASIAIHRVYADGTISHVNEQMCRNLGYTRAELDSMNVVDFDPAITPEQLTELANLIRENGTYTFESVNRRKDGTVFPVEITVDYWNVHGHELGMAFVQDITERKMAEKQLKKKKQELEALNRTLRQRVKNEVAKNREKDIILIQQNRQAALGETLEHILHQWKQPLQTIGILVEYLESHYSDGLLTDDFVRDTVDKTMYLLKHMAQTAEDFMDYYRPEKDKKAFSIKETLEEALSFIEPEFRHRKITVGIDADQELTGHGFPKEFAQVLLIILTNARDAFKERRTEHPSLTIKAFAKGKKAVVTITDNAGGIPEKSIGKVFDLYFTTKETTGGTGIGLYMAKSIIERHMSGRLTVTNVDGGTRFRIEIGAPKHGSG